MPYPVVNAHRNVDILVNVERCGEALCKSVNDVVIRIRTIVKLSTKGRLPLLGLHYAVGIWGMKNKAFEI